MKNDTDNNKKMLIAAMEKHLGIITAACKECGLSRETFYTYYKRDAEFKKQIDLINELTLDFVETQLLKKIKEGSERSILFYMKYRGKQRGYTDSIDITSGGDKISEIKLVEVKKPNE
jgi:hypothetical protein